MNNCPRCGSPGIIMDAEEILVYPDEIRGIFPRIENWIYYNEYYKIWECHKCWNKIELLLDLDLIVM